MATWAVLIRFLFGLTVPLGTGTATPCDEKQHTRIQAIAPNCFVLRACTQVGNLQSFLYGDVITVISGDNDHWEYGSNRVTVKVESMDKNSVKDSQFQESPSSPSSI